MMDRRQSYTTTLPPIVTPKITGSHVLQAESQVLKEQQSQEAILQEKKQANLARLVL